MGIVFVATAVLAGWSGTQAADYPSKPIKIVVGLAPGSANDLRARQIAAFLQARLGQPVVVENKTGASGSIAAALVARSKPDGYTVLSCTGSSHGVNPVVMPDLGYDAVTDFAPVVRIVTVPFVLVVTSSLPVRSVLDLIKLAKAKPGQLMYGSGGNATSFHIAAELFAHEASIELLHVPYKGDGPAMVDTMAGHVQMLFSPPIASLPQIKAGRLRALAITGPRRLAALPDVPTMAEQGLPGVELIVWAGLCAPGGTPRSVIEILNRETLAAVLAPETKAELERQGYEASPNTPEEFGEFIQQEIARYKKLVKELNIRAD